jgi:hypothetical protein
MNTLPPSQGPTVALLTVSVVAVTLTALGSSAEVVQQIISQLLSLTALYVINKSGRDPS